MTHYRRANLADARASALALRAAASGFWDVGEVDSLIDDVLSALGVSDEND